VISKVSHRQGKSLTPQSPDTVERWATLSYLGAIFVVPVVPLAVYLGRRHRSAFLRGHAAQALNVALTCLLYAVSGAIIGALLSFDNPNDALLIMVPVATIGWLVMLTQLVRAAAAASRGEFRRLPSWICTPMVR
jgi:uncharacterized Tic20 family protein